MKYPLKKALKTPENDIDKRFAGSIPAPGTIKSLIVSKLENTTDKKMTKKQNYKVPGIYDAGGDTSKQWFVFYSFKDPETGKFKRFKVFQDINSFRNKGERYERAKSVQIAVKELLEEGFSPFEEFKPDDDFSITNCIDVFLDKSKSSLKRKSYNRYYYEFRLMKQWFTDNGIGDLHVSKVRKKHIVDHLEFAKKHGQWTSGKTYNTHKSNIARLFNYFINNYDDVIEKNPATRIESKPVVTRGNRPYTDSEFNAIKEAILERDPYLWRICQFVYYAAVRNEQEGLNMKIGYIDFSGRKIILPPEITKSKSNQYIPIYPEFIEVLEEMKLREYPPNYYVFGRGDKPGPERVGKDNFYERFKKIRDSIGLSKHHGIYAFKHTRGCHMIDDGASLYEIQTLFRHTNLQATMEYLKSIGRVIGEKKLTKSRVV